MHCSTEIPLKQVNYLVNILERGGERIRLSLGDVHDD